MSNAASGPTAYQVVYSERVRQRLLALADVARERGRRIKALAYCSQLARPYGGLTASG